jgi:hypothetical protein
MSDDEVGGSPPPKKSPAKQPSLKQSSSKSTPPKQQASSSGSSSSSNNNNKQQGTPKQPQKQQSSGSNKDTGGQKQALGKRNTTGSSEFLEQLDQVSVLFLLLFVVYYTIRVLHSFILLHFILLFIYRVLPRNPSSSDSFFYFVPQLY